MEGQHRQRPRTRRPVYNEVSDEQWETYCQQILKNHHNAARLTQACLPGLEWARSRFEWILWHEPDGSAHAVSRQQYADSLK